jgi:hypothetical protein
MNTVSVEACPRLQVVLPARARLSLSLVVFALFSYSPPYSVVVGDGLLRDPDTLWHIGVGRRILQTGSFPWVDHLSHTFEGHPWIARDWLSEVIFALGVRGRRRAGGCRRHRLDVHAAVCGVGTADAADGCAEHFDARLYPFFHSLPGPSARPVISMSGSMACRSGSRGRDPHFPEPNLASSDDHFGRSCTAASLSASTRIQTGNSSRPRKNSHQHHRFAPLLTMQWSRNFPTILKILLTRLSVFTMRPCALLEECKSIS